MGWSNAEKERVSKLEENLKQLEKKCKKQGAVNKSLAAGLKLAIGEIKRLSENNNDLRTNINKLNYQIDAHGQYNRRESGRLLETPEAKQGETDDAVNHVLESANFVLSQIDDADDDFSDLKDYKVTLSDLQRCHRVGDEKKARERKKTRPIIAKFKDYRLRMAILLNKKKLGKNAQFKAQGRFFTEDLTPFRNKLLWYTKNHVKDPNDASANLFYHVHTREGKIKARKKGGDARKWVTIVSPDDFLAHGHTVNVDILNKDFHQFQILKHLEYDDTHLTNLLEECANALKSYDE